MMGSRMVVCRKLYLPLEAPSLWIGVNGGEECLMATDQSWGSRYKIGSLFFCSQGGWQDYMAMEDADASEEPGKEQNPV